MMLVGVKPGSKLRNAVKVRKRGRGRSLHGRERHGAQQQSETRDNQSESGMREPRAQCF